MDCQGRGGLTEAEFCSLLLQSLGDALATRVPWDELGSDKAPADLLSLEDPHCQSQPRRGFGRLIILDEFEAIAASQHLTPDFFSSLRRIVTQYPVAIVTVTKDPLTMLTYPHQGILSSPFFNIFQPLSLGLYSAGEAADDAAGLAGKSDFRFAQATLDFILDLAGGHPLLLQLAGFHAFELLECRPGDLSADDRQLVRERFWVTAAQHFEYYWSHLDEDSRYVLATLPLLSDSADGVVETLARECLIVPTRAGP